MSTSRWAPADRLRLLLAGPGALLAVAVVQPAWADGIDKSAFELYQQCETVTSRFLQGVCLGYLAAAIASDVSAGEAESRVCPPPDLRLQTVRGEFIAFVEGNRSMRDVPAHEAVIATMQAYYPCDGTPAPAAGVSADPPDYGLSVEQD